MTDPELLETAGRALFGADWQSPKRRLSMDPTELRATLARLRLRQVALARELGVHRVTVARWVAGKVEVPRHVAAWLALYARSANGPPSREGTDAPGLGRWHRGMKGSRQAMIEAKPLRNP